MKSVVLMLALLAVGCQPQQPTPFTGNRGSGCNYVCYRTVSLMANPSKPEMTIVVFENMRTGKRISIQVPEAEVKRNWAVWHVNNVTAVTAYDSFWLEHEPKNTKPLRKPAMDQ